MKLVSDRLWKGWPKSSPDSHKGDYGRLLMAGPIPMAGYYHGCLGRSRSGAGLSCCNWTGKYSCPPCPSARAMAFDLQERAINGADPQGYCYFNRTRSLAERDSLEEISATAGLQLVNKQQSCWSWMGALSHFMAIYFPKVETIFTPHRKRMGEACHPALTSSHRRKI